MDEINGGGVDGASARVERERADRRGVRAGQGVHGSAASRVGWGIQATLAAHADSEDGARSGQAAGGADDARRERRQLVVERGFDAELLRNIVLALAETR